MAEQDTLIPRRQGGGLMKYRVAPTSTSYLPQVTLVVSDGPFYLQDYLDPQEARNLAALLIAVADGLACGECHGNGVVQVNPSPIGDPQSEDETACPVCLGTGAPA